LFLEFLSMGFATSPVTGPTTITGLTSPTYTLVDDTAPDVNGKQQAVSALGGTQVGVNLSSVAAPFTISVFRPKAFKVLGALDAVTGAPKGVGGRNTYSIIVRKGVLPLAGQPYQNLVIRTEISIPAGADVADAVNIKAAIAALAGVLMTDANKICSLGLTGVIA
jgi:hypothetical protein